MAQIVFEVARWKNFLSTGNSWNQIQLNKHKSALIVGKNGSGKSTVLDALTFALFGKSFRNINKPLLVNSINGKECLVELEFSIQTKKYKIRRGIKPNVFEMYLDGLLIDQDAATKDYQSYLENSILKFNYKAFTQIVILGSSSFIPFMKLSASDRRSIIEDLLDIQIFSSMNSVVKDNLSQIKLDSVENKTALEGISQQLQLQKKFIEDAKKNTDAEIEKKTEDRDENLRHIEEHEEKCDLVQRHTEQLLNSIRDKDLVVGKIGSLGKMGVKINETRRKIQKDLDFYEQNDECPTCTQEITQTFKQNITAGRKKKVEEIDKGLVDLNDQLNKMVTRNKEIQDVITKVNEHQAEVARYGATIKQLRKNVEKQNKEIEELKNKKPMDGNLEKLARELYAKYQELIATRERISNEKAYAEAAAILLKDSGIKARIVKQYLPIINKLVNKYLASLDFFVNFEMDEEFKEKIKSRHRDDFSYDNFSEGERMRIDLSLLFTFRAIARMKNSINTNLLIMDEIFDGAIDSSGTDELMKLIDQLSEDSNIFVISHKTDALIDKFGTVMKFEKVKNFSQMEIA
jgi:DNA repair exonuclease SbcCD ATPase subunit